MKFLSVVALMAEISPMCSIIVASEMGTMAIIELMIRLCWVQSMAKIVLLLCTGRPIQAASATAEKSIAQPSTPKPLPTMSATA